MEISHLVAVGRQNWGAVSKVLELVDAANDDGAEVGVDVYPYIAGNCPLSQILPYWAQEGGDNSLRERLSDPEARRSITGSWAERSGSWSELVVSRAPNYEDLAGRSLQQAADDAGLTPEDLALDLLAEMGNAVTITAYGRSEEDVLTVLRHPVAVIGSDGQALDVAGATGAGLPHPRSFGCYPRLLSRYIGEDIPVERAVHMSSEAVARRVGLERRGRVAHGCWADLVVFDPGSITDRATFDAPQQYPEGIRYVLVNGVVVVDPDGHVGARPGLCLVSRG
jgi:N-acyl-D-aspartate/D-glutamate deacylase